MPDESPTCPSCGRTMHDLPDVAVVLRKERQRLLDVIDDERQSLQDRFYIIRHLLKTSKA